MMSYLLAPLSRPLLHGNYGDDIAFGIVFVVMLVVFLRFYFTEPEDGDQDEDQVE